MALNSLELLESSLKKSELRRKTMKKSAIGDRVSISNKSFVNDLRDIKVFLAASAEEKCWQTYYEDLYRAALKIRSLSKK